MAENGNGADPDPNPPPGAPQFSEGATISDVIDHVALCLEAIKAKLAATGGDDAEED